MIKYYIIIFIMTFIGSVASFYLKKASNNITPKNFLKNINVYIGGLLYLISALLNIYVLKYLNYSIVLPLTSITYIWTMIISHRLLKEKITKRKVIGILLITIGAVIITL